MPIGPDIDLKAISEDARAEGFSGADLAALMRESAMCALRQDLDAEKRYLSSSLPLLPEKTCPNIPLLPGRCHFVTTNPLLFGPLVESQCQPL